MRFRSALPKLANRHGTLFRTSTQKTCASFAPRISSLCVPPGTYESVEVVEKPSGSGADGGMPACSASSSFA